MVAVKFTGAGDNDVIELVQHDSPEPSADEVVVAVRFAALNPADVVQRRGFYPAPEGSPQDIPGIEVAGTVAAVGASVSEWSVGDRVFGLVGGGGLSDRVRVHRRHLARVPSNLSDAEAAAVPEAFITAHDAVRTQAELRMGEVLLVRGANGGVGSAAVQIGLANGSSVIGVSRSERGRDLVRALGAEALSPDEADELTGAADVVLELVGAPHIPADIQALRLHGRIVVIGVGDGADAELPLGQLMGRRARLYGSSLRGRSIEDKAATLRAFEREVLPHLESGRIRPVIDSVFDVSQVRDAFAHLEEGAKNGKVLLEFS